MALTRLETHYLFTFPQFYATFLRATLQSLGNWKKKSRWKCSKTIFFYLRHPGVYRPFFDYTPFKSLSALFAFLACVHFVFVKKLVKVVFLLHNHFNLMYYLKPLEPQRGTVNWNTNWKTRCINELFRENYLSLTLCLLANCFNYAIKCL